MATSKLKKTELLTYFKEKVLTQKSIVFLSTAGAESSLDSKTNVNLRKQARTQGVEIKVLKNTLTKKLFPVVEGLDGQTYIAYSENTEATDEVTVPKVVIKLATGEYKQNFKVVGAVVNGEFLDSSKAISLSKVPSKQDSMAMVAGSLNSLISKIPRLVKEVSCKVARAVNETAKTKA